MKAERLILQPYEGYINLVISKQIIIFVIRNDADKDITTKVDIKTKSNYLPRKEADGYIVTRLNIIVKITLNVTSLLRGSFILIINLMIWLV